MHPVGAVATGTYFWKIPAFVEFRFGSVAIAARPAAVGACTAPPPTEMNPTGLRSKLVKKNNLFLTIGPPTVAPYRLLSKRGFEVSNWRAQVVSTALRLRLRKYSYTEPCRLLVPL